MPGKRSRNGSRASEVGKSERLILASGRGFV
jgi:hypothetical protein